MMAAGSKFRSSRLKSVLISLVKSLLFLSLVIPLRGLLCPVPGVLGVAGRPGVCGVQGVCGPSPPLLSRLATASDIWDSGPSSRGYWPDTMPGEKRVLVLIFRSWPDLLFMSGGA